MDLKNDVWLNSILTEYCQMKNAGKQKCYKDIKEIMKFNKIFSELSLSAEFFPNFATSSDN
jgi:hypothetical protein